MFPLEKRFNFLERKGLNYLKEQLLVKSKFPNV
jgi:hypothetical protein